MVEWKTLNSREQIDEIVSRSVDVPQLIFKHSTRCSISAMAKGRLERQEGPSGVDFYFLDLIRHRDLSNEIARIFKVQHESPQVILIKNGEGVFHASHSGVSMNSIISAL